MIFMGIFAERFFDELSHFGVVMESDIYRRQTIVYLSQINTMRDLKKSMLNIINLSGNTRQYKLKQ